MTRPQRQAVRYLLLDVEGTTTPIAFVHEVLFPYARTHTRSYLLTNSDLPEVREDIASLRTEHARDLQQNLSPPELLDGAREDRVDSIVSYIHGLIDRDRKSTGLKALQGKIWRAGYADGTLRATLYPDVWPAFERWRRAELRIAIFSSGSVEAQQLLFAHSDAGDATQFISQYFDTNAGPKTASESYGRIATALQVLPEEILFVSDVVAELDAAKAAGVQTLLCVRPGNKPQPTGHHRAIHSFEEILN